MTSTNNQGPLPVVGRKEKSDGNIRFTIPTVDGLGLPPFPGLMQDGPAERLMNIKNLDTRDDDIILATFPKSGVCAVIQDTIGKRRDLTRSYANRYVKKAE